MIYVASSWRNPLYEGVLAVLRAAQLPFYDFRHPAPGNDGFSWREIDPDWQQWTPARYREALSHPLAWEGFHADMDALKACHTLLLVLPCGRSAHLELGYAIGAGKRTIIYYPQDIQIEPERKSVMRQTPQAPEPPAMGERRARWGYGYLDVLPRINSRDSQDRGLTPETE